MDSAESGRRSSGVPAAVEKLGLDSGDNTSKAQRKRCVDAKAEFLATRETRAECCIDPRVRSECSAFPASSRVVRYFTAHAIYGFEGRFSMRGAGFTDRKTRCTSVQSLVHTRCAWRERVKKSGQQTRSRAGQAFRSPHDSNAMRAARQKPCCRQAGGRGAQSLTSSLVPPQSRLCPAAQPALRRRALTQTR